MNNSLRPRFASTCTYTLSSSSSSALSSHSTSSLFLTYFALRDLLRCPWPTLMSLSFLTFLTYIGYFSLNLFSALDLLRCPWPSSLTSALSSHSTCSSASSLTTSTCRRGRYWSSCSSYTRWQHFSALNDVTTTGRLEITRLYQKSDSVIDTYLPEEQSCQISPRSDLKRWSFRLFWNGRPNNKNNKMSINTRSVSGPKMNA